MALEAYCASCTFLKDEIDYRGKFWCSKKGQDIN